MEEKVVETKVENKTETKAEVKKEVKAKVEIPKKEEAVARGLGIHASKKQSMYICSFIKYKKIDEAIRDLELVVKLKKAVPFKGEIPHRKGKGMMSGRYPVNASKLFIQLLKGLKGSVIVNGLDLDKTIIVEAVASGASRPMRSEGTQGKRVNVTIKAREKKVKNYKGEKQ